MINPGLAQIIKEFPDLAQNYMNLMLSESKDCVCIYETDQRRLRWIGGEKEVFSENTSMVIVPEYFLEHKYIHVDSEKDFCDIFKQISSGAEIAIRSIQMKSAKEDEYRWVNISITAIRENVNEKKYAIVVFSDATVEIAPEKQYFHEEQLRAMLSEDVIAVSKVNMTEDKVEYIWGANVEPEKLKKVTTYEQMYKVGYRSIYGKESKEKYYQTFEYSQLMKNAEKGQSRLALEYQYMKNTGEILWAAMNANMVHDSKTGCLYYYSFIRDIDEKKRAELALRKKAERDTLTGLYNKGTIEMIIRESVNRSRIHKKICAMMVIDIDNFKDINDTYGHHYGDYVLSQVGDILSRVYGDSIMKGRFGGDEFLVFAAGISSMEWAFQKAHQVKDVMLQAFYTHSGGFKLTFSMGIVFSEGGEETFDDLFKQADTALYEAKKNGKDQYSVFCNETYLKSVAAGRNKNVI